MRTSELQTMPRPKISPAPALRRRGLLGSALAVAMGLAAAGPVSAVEPSRVRPVGYGALVDRGIAIPAVPLTKVPQRFRRQTVRYGSEHPPGTIVVDPAQHYLYLIQDKGHALRYGVSVGKGAFGWSGQAVVAKTLSWPQWTPPPEMIERSRNLSIYKKGLEGGAFNPLGARALYLHQGGRDTLYRIHGTSEWWSIGDDASSGCIRLLNQDVIDLAARVQPGTTVIVLQPKSLWRR